MFREEIGALLDADHQLIRHGAFRNSEALRDFAVRKTVQFAQRENLATAGGQRLNRLGEQRELLVARDDLGNAIGVVLDLCLLYTSPSPRD